MKFEPVLLKSVFVFCFAILSTNALAALGGRAESIQGDSAGLSAVQSAPQTVSNGNYNVTTLQSPGMTVREYSDSNGVVFGVTWSGRMHPDFATILGEHYSEYSNEAEKQKSSPMHQRGAHVVKTGSMVLESAGHMGSQHGRAYLPGQIPSGVSVDEIK